jgi:hypothetical protein
MIDLDHERRKAWMERSSQRWNARPYGPRDPNPDEPKESIMRWYHWVAVALMIIIVVGSLVAHH